MRENGQRVTCDECCGSTFLRATGDGEADGGYTRWNKFEPMPDGWGTYMRVVGGRLTRLDLCPSCNAAIQAKVEAAWAELDAEVGR